MEGFERTVKCPSCQFVSSDLRDLCPKCLHDLRVEKKQAGLAVSYPEATYQELLQKLTGSPSNLTPAENDSKKTESFFSRLFKKSSKSPSISVTTTEIQPKIVQPLILNPTTTEQDAIENKMKELFDIEEENNITSEFKNTLDIQENTQEALSDNYSEVKIEESEMEEFKVSPSETPPNNEREFSPPLEDIDNENQDQDKVIFDTPYKEETEIIELPKIASDIEDLVAQALDQAEELEEYPHYAQPSEYIDADGGVNIEPHYEEELSSIQPYSSTNELGNYRVEPENIFVENETMQVKECDLEDQFEEISYEDLGNSDAPNNDTEIIEQSNGALPTSQEYKVDDIEIEALFNEASHEISTLIEGIHFDIAVAPSINVNKDEIEVLFSLSKREIDSPCSLSDLIEEVDLSSSREIESVDITSALEQTEKAIESPKFSLKELIKDEANRLRRKLIEGIDTDKLIYGKRFKGPAPAPIWKRMVASTIDTTLVIAITFMIVGFLCLTLTPELFDKLWNLTSYELYIALPIYGLIFATYVITYFLYPILSVYFMHNTFGMYLTGIRLRTNDLKKLRLTHLFVRSFSRPASILLGGFLLPLFGKKSLPDYLAQTVVIS